MADFVWGPTYKKIFMEFVEKYEETFSEGVENIERHDYGQIFQFVDILICLVIVPYIQKASIGVFENCNSQFENFNDRNCLGRQISENIHRFS